MLLTDRYPRRDTLPIHALLATGAVHPHLVESGLRCDCNLIVETGTARDAHHFACLIGFGATAVYPYLAYQTLFDLGRAASSSAAKARRAAQIGRSYRRGIRKGLLKILSKMGICTIASYRGAQLFEIVGLAPEVVDLCFPGTPSRIGGAGFADLEDDAAPARRARPGTTRSRCAPAACCKYVHGGEYHMYNPDVVGTLQRAVRSGDHGRLPQTTPTPSTRARRRRCATCCSCKRPARRSRSTRSSRSRRSCKRFDSAGMSLGALSPEAHEALAIAMNRLGARSNSGEGGEDPARYGTEKRIEDQAGRVRPLRRHAGIPGQRRSAADQDRAGRQARRRRPAARPQGQRD